MDHRRYTQPSANAILHWSIGEQRMLDKDGYPTEETLDKIEHWPISNAKDAEELMTFVSEIWWPGDGYGWMRSAHRHREYKGGTLRRYYKISTGGWSGNESLICAMEENRMFWMLTWLSSRRGGHYEFRV
jgi:hypothetical protein